MDTAFSLSYGFASSINIFCFYQAKTLRNKDLIEMYLSPLITCIPGLISNAPDDSKGYVLEVLIDLLSSL